MAVPIKHVINWSNDQLRVILLAFHDHYGYECYAETLEVSVTELRTIFEMVQYEDFDKERKKIFGTNILYPKDLTGIIIDSIYTKIEEDDCKPNSILVMDFANNYDRIAGGGIYDTSD